MRKSKGLCAALIILLSCFIISFSVAVPILVRPFYYVQIQALDLPGQTGWSEEVIRAAYDDVLDFCVLGGPFSTGDLAFSDAGKSHFEDVQVLFRLDLLILAVSAAGILALLLLCRRKKCAPFRPAGRGPGFWAGAGVAAVFLAVGGLAALDFDRAFTVFHSLFFPGKANWIFDPATDEIILVMPEVFFQNCAILIVAVLFCCCLFLLCLDFVLARRQRPAPAAAHR